MLECMVNLGQICDWTRRNRDDFDCAIFRLGSCHSVMGTHAPLAGIKQHFSEFCLKDERKCNVVGKILEGEEYEVIGNVCKRKSDSWNNLIRTTVIVGVLAVIVIKLLKDQNW